MSYTILFKKEAAKELKCLPSKIVVRISTAIDGLSNNPRPVGCKKLEGKKANIWRIRAGNYRILYLIDDTIRIINIHKIGHRKNIYD